MKLQNYIWYEKYRPKTLKNLILPKWQRKKFSKYIKEKNIPHLLLHGPPGSGKTTLSFILINEINAVKIVLNASSEDRGIETIRGKIKTFASSSALNNRLKIVFLDEGDMLTEQAQKALRNTIETYSGKCRFIFTANYVERINSAIRSRCTEFEFETFPKEKLFIYIDSILDEEKITYKIKDVESVIDIFYPDIRTIVNKIQLCSNDGKLKVGNVIGKFLDLKTLGDYLKEGQILEIRKLCKGRTSFMDVYRYFMEDYILNLPVKQDQKSGIAIVVAEYLYRDSLVVDKEINFTGCCLEMMREMDVKGKWK